MIALPASGMVQIPCSASALISVLFPEPGPPVNTNRRSESIASIPPPHANERVVAVLAQYCPLMASRNSNWSRRLTLVAFLFSAALLRSCTGMSIPDHLIAFHVVDFALHRSACCINVIAAFSPTQFLKRPDSNGSGETVSTFHSKSADVDWT